MSAEIALVSLAWFGMWIGVALLAIWIALKAWRKVEQWFSEVLDGCAIETR